MIGLLSLSFLAVGLSFSLIFQTLISSVWSNSFSKTSLFMSIVWLQIMKKILHYKCEYIQTFMRPFKANFMVLRHYLWKPMTFWSMYCPKKMLKIPFKPISKSQKKWWGVCFFSFNLLYIAIEIGNEALTKGTQSWEPKKYCQLA